jgi:DnaJ-class molecular chaperone
MTEAEAYQILGLKFGASKQDISEAHRKLIQKNHPDHGGSDYLAAKINLARKTLLRK